MTLRCEIAELVALGNIARRWERFALIRPRRARTGDHLVAHHVVDTARVADGAVGFVCRASALVGVGRAALAFAAIRILKAQPFGGLGSDTLVETLVGVARGVDEAHFLVDGADSSIFAVRVGDAVARLHRDGAALSATGDEAVDTVRRSNAVVVEGAVRAFVAIEITKALRRATLGDTASFFVTELVTIGRRRGRTFAGAGGRRRCTVALFAHRQHFADKSISTLVVVGATGGLVAPFDAASFNPARGEAARVAAVDTRRAPFFDGTGFVGTAVVVAKAGGTRTGFAVNGHGEGGAVAALVVGGAVTAIVDGLAVGVLGALFRGQRVAAAVGADTLAGLPAFADAATAAVFGFVAVVGANHLDFATLVGAAIAAIEAAFEGTAIGAVKLFDDRVLVAAAVLVVGGAITRGRCGAGPSASPESFAVIALVTLFGGQTKAAVAHRRAHLLALGAIARGLFVAGAAFAGARAWEGHQSAAIDLLALVDAQIAAGIDLDAADVATVLRVEDRAGVGGAGRQVDGIVFAASVDANAFGGQSHVVTTVGVAFKAGGFGGGLGGAADFAGTTVGVAEAAVTAFDTAAVAHRGTGLAVGADGRGLAIVLGVAARSVAAFGIIPAHGDVGDGAFAQRTAFSVESVGIARQIAVGFIAGARRGAGEKNPAGRGHDGEKNGGDAKQHRLRCAATVRWLIGGR